MFRGLRGLIPLLLPACVTAPEASFLQTGWGRIMFSILVGKLLIGVFSAVFTCNLMIEGFELGLPPFIMASCFVPSVPLSRRCHLSGLVL